MAYAAYDMHFFLKCPKIEHIQFRGFSRFKIDPVFFSRNAPLFTVCSFSLKCPNFPIWFWKWGISGILNIKKWGISRKNAWLILKREKHRNWICSILGHFRKTMHMPSRAKVILHILFGAFQETYRIKLLKLSHDRTYFFDRILKGVNNPNHVTDFKWYI